MSDHDKRIAEMDREELRDLLITLQQKTNDYMRAMRKNFEKACSADKRKEEAEARINELEDWGISKPIKRGNIHVATPSGE